MRTRPARRAKRSPLPPLLAALAVAAAILVYAGVWPKIARRAQYPLACREYVEAGAAEFGLEEAHVYAVILCESSFRENAASRAGALGLMQIMPDTGRWIAGKLGEEFQPEDLLDGATNVRYGCWFLGYLARRYGGDLDTVSAAYHAGNGNVDKWLLDPAFSADGLTIDTTPYPSTNEYMKKVHKAYDEYQKILSAGR